jgi:hypothetical protein
MARNSLYHVLINMPFLAIRIIPRRQRLQEGQVLLEQWTILQVKALVLSFPGEDFCHLLAGKAAFEGS